MDQYTLMRLSEEMDDDAVEPMDLTPEQLHRAGKNAAERFKDDYFGFYDDVKISPKEDW